METDLIEIARIKGPNGLKGKMWVTPYGDCFERFSAYTHLIVGNQGLPRRMISCSARKGKYILELEGITDITQVENITGQSLFITREQLPCLEEDEYYWADILGMRVIDTQGKELGEIVDIFPTGSNDVFVVDKDKHYYIPYTKDVIRDILIDERKVIVDSSLLEGLLD